MCENKLIYIAFSNECIVFGVWVGGFGGWWVPPPTIPHTNREELLRNRKGPRRLCFWFVCVDVSVFWHVSRDIIIKGGILLIIIVYMNYYNQ